MKFSCTAVLFVLLAWGTNIAPARAEFHWPSWLGGKSTTVTNANTRGKSSARTASAAGKGKSKNLFTSGPSLFKRKPKSKVISKWPSDESHSDRGTKSGEKKSWFGSMFGSSEPPPPKTVSDWMDLEQIKP